MSSTLSLKGSLEVGGNACVGGCSVGIPDRHVFGLSLGVDCANEFYETVIEAPTPIKLATSGLVGAQFVDVGGIRDVLVAVEFLYLSTTAPIQARIGALPAVVTGSGGTFPTTFAGGETLTLTVDGTAVTVTFGAADQTAEQVASAINAAVAAAGIFSEVADVNASGQLTLTGVETGAQGSVVVTGGTGAATLGLTGLSATGGGADVPVRGLFVVQFGRYPDVPARVQLSGTASVKLLAAGRSSV